MSACDQRPVGRLAADGGAQGARQPIAVEAPQHHAFGAQMIVRCMGIAALGVREMDEQEIADARRCLKAEGGDLLDQPGHPPVVVAHRVFKVAGVIDRRDAGGLRGQIDVERPADAVENIGDLRRAIGPAEAQRRQAIGLGEGARHDHVGHGGDQFDARLIVVAPHIFRIGRIDHQHHPAGQRLGQALDLVEGDIGAGRVVGVGKEHHGRLRRHLGQGCCRRWR